MTISHPHPSDIRLRFVRRCHHSIMVPSVEETALQRSFSPDVINFVVGFSSRCFVSCRTLTAIDRLTNGLTVPHSFRQTSEAFFCEANNGNDRDFTSDINCENVSLICHSVVANTECAAIGELRPLPKTAHYNLRIVSCLRCSRHSRLTVMLGAID